ncbi:DUF3313 family protein [Phenylobacterium immobile]|uniref:DUF3313 family protein n=1 Tax=Phenylobacterium immobile TaxID=21 RepID=UPI000AC45344|nr:DUF3313 family protein [Phenylobacterium immobile]
MRIHRQASGLAGLVLTCLGLNACQSVPKPSGYLSRYDTVGSAQAPMGAARAQRRDDAASDNLTAVYIQPAVLALQTPSRLSAQDQEKVRAEVDRQVCFEISERFDVLAAPAPDAGLVRTAIVRITPTGRFGSAVSAAAGFFIPAPILNVRTPTTTGGLAAETELLAPGGEQIAALRWSRTAEVVSSVNPSMSRVGDALQLAEPYGDAVGDAFASEARKVRKIADPDPCARFGVRRDIGRSLASGVVGVGSGLYVPEISGAGKAAVD